VADVERFTRLWENPPDEMTAAVTRFEQTVSEVVAAYGGVRPAEPGVGVAPAAQPATCPGWYW
jgi:class 3 adenylate cyclase